MEEQSTPVELLSLNEIMAVSALLQFYEKHMRNTSLPSATRSQQGVDITLLIMKLSLSPLGETTSLTEEDIGYVQAAFRVFLSQVRRKIPPSQQTENILVSCKLFLRTSFPQSHLKKESREQWSKKKSPIPMSLMPTIQRN